MTFLFFITVQKGTFNSKQLCIQQQQWSRQMPLPTHNFGPIGITHSIYILSLGHVRFLGDLDFRIGLN